MERKVFVIELDADDEAHLPDSAVVLGEVDPVEAALEVLRQHWPSAV